MLDTSSFRISDPLSEVLGALNLRGSLYMRTEARSPWAISFPKGEGHFHVVERGNVVATAHGAKKPVVAVAGDLLVFPHGEGHVIGDRAGRKAVDLETIVRKGWDANARLLRVGVGEADVRMICGVFALDRAGRAALLSALPPILHLQGRSGRPSTNVDLVVQLFVTEANGTSPGSALCAARLIDLLLVQAIRDWLARQPAHLGGWLGAMRDPHVGAALSALYDRPGHPWTVEDLAARVGLSRSPLAARFTRLVGEPPLRYLTRWRMHLAAQMLKEGASVREAAERVGYESEAAFSRMFKRWMGRAPVTFRGKGISSHV